MKLVISLATRGRPDRLIETVKRSVVNWTDPNTELQIQVDSDDQATIGALATAMPFKAYVPLDSQRVTQNVQQREDTIAAKWNRAVSTPADLYLVAADDDPYITPGYDTALLDAANRFPDGIGMVYGALANLSFSGAVAPTARFVELFGGVIFPPLFPYWFVDHWTDDVAKMIGRISYANIRTDQSKPGVTQEMREPAWWATFYDCAYLYRRSQAEAFWKHPDFICPKWQEDVTRSLWPMIDHRSRMLNQTVRNEAARLSSWAGNLAVDERYLRVKRQAVAMVPKLLQEFGMPEDERKMFAQHLGVVL